MKELKAETGNLNKKKFLKEINFYFGKLLETFLRPSEQLWQGSNTKVYFDFNTFTYCDDLLNKGKKREEKASVANTKYCTCTNRFSFLGSKCCHIH